MAQKSPVDPSIELPYRDLASEVTRRRVTMDRREDVVTKKGYEAGESLSHVGTEQTPPPRKTYLTVPPAPPPSPAEDPISQPKPLLSSAFHS
ncbi:myocilin opposite strand protein [Marmota monax]|uniref:myocilin opposite strand protein n=1 Tax=Marmota monax TaxID=9995 RepID=UPI001EB0273F|nr:myocilin opposite strand protein [Marmota monax]